MPVSVTVQPVHSRKLGMCTSDYVNHPEIALCEGEPLVRSPCRLSPWSCGNETATVFAGEESTERVDRTMIAFGIAAFAKNLAVPF